MWTCVAPVVLRRVRFADAWQRALEIVDLKQEAVAAAMGDLSKTQLSMAVHGLARFPYDRLIMAAEDDPQIAHFMHVLHALIQSALGEKPLDPIDTMRIALEQLAVERRMVKASIATTATERRSA